MYIIPIIVRPLETTFDTIIRQVWLFLERNGTHCMTANSAKEATEFAAANEIPLTGAPIISENFIYLPVDSTADLSSFYMWSEIRPNEQPMKEVWRSFLWIVRNDCEEDVWGTNKFLKDIFIAGSDSVYTVLEDYFRPGPKTK